MPQNYNVQQLGGCIININIQHYVYITCCVPMSYTTLAMTSKIEKYGHADHQISEMILTLHFDNSEEIGHGIKDGRELWTNTLLQFADFFTKYNIDESNNSRAKILDRLEDIRLYLSVAVAETKGTIDGMPLYVAASNASHLKSRMTTEE